MIGDERIEKAVDACRHKQILLLEAEQAAVFTRVVGVEDRTDRLGVCPISIGERIVAAVERIEVEVLLNGLGAPNAKLVDGFSAKPTTGIS